MGAILEFFDNKTVSAFAGGLTAFILVVVTDWRRERRKLKHIRSEIELTGVVAANKLETVRRNRTMVRENSLMAAPILKFNAAMIRSMMGDVLDKLPLDQRRALEAVCYWMEAIDELLADTYSRAKSIRDSKDQAERHDSGKQLIDDYGDAIVNLKILSEMCASYRAGHYTEIITKQYDRTKYEER